MKRNSKKSDLSGDSDELRELLGPVALPHLAAEFGVSKAGLQRWLDGLSKPPPAVMSLCRMRFAGDLSEILGPDWRDVRIGAGGLSLPGWRRPFSAPEVKSTFFRLQQLALFEHDNARLRRERGEAWKALQAAEEAREYYRQQLRLESRLGLMLQAVTA